MLFWISVAGFAAPALGTLSDRRWHLFPVYYVFRYRKDIVMHNLDQAFPGRLQEKKKAIAKQFYHNLIDTFIETIKMISASPRMLDRRMLGTGK